MSTVDDAVEAGARALHDLWDDTTEYGTYGEMATTAARAVWPILSAPIRELHPERMGQYGHSDCLSCTGDGDWVNWPCPDMQAVLATDRALGIEQPR